MGTVLLHQHDVTNICRSRGLLPDWTTHRLVPRTVVLQELHGGLTRQIRHLIVARNQTLLQHKADIRKETITLLIVKTYVFDGQHMLQVLEQFDDEFISELPRLSDGEHQSSGRQHAWWVVREVVLRVCRTQHKK